MFKRRKHKSPLANMRAFSSRSLSRYGRSRRLRLWLALLGSIFLIVAVLLFYKLERIINGFSPPLQEKRVSLTWNEKP